MRKESKLSREISRNEDSIIKNHVVPLPSEIKKMKKLRKFCGHLSAQLQNSPKDLDRTMVEMKGKRTNNAIITVAFNSNNRSSKLKIQ